MLAAVIVLAYLLAGAAIMIGLLIADPPKCASEQRQAVDVALAFVPFWPLFLLLLLLRWQFGDPMHWF